MNVVSPRKIPIAFDEDPEPCSDLPDILSSARQAQELWAKVPISQRLVQVSRLRSLLAENALELAAASSAARGRPPAESLTAEVVPFVEACRFLERNAKRILASRRLGPIGRPLWLNGVSAEIHREPFGVVLIIAPGNYPLFLAGVQVLQSLVAGNAVLLKPGRGGTQAALGLERLIGRAGFPDSLVTVLPESVDVVGSAIAARPDKVLFTGSAGVGEEVLAQLAPRLIPAALELSGCDAVIVRADADLELTAKALAFGLRLNNGATCLAPRRVFAASSIVGELEQRLSRLVAETSSRLSERGATALPDRALLAHGDFRALLDEALSLGARLLTGGFSRHGEWRWPIVLSQCSPRARLLQTDVFLPVLSIVSVTTDEQAIRWANACPFALGASVFSRDEATARRVADRLHAGVVTVNDLILPTADPRVPFGGRNRSGYGVTRGAEGLLNLTRPKVVSVTRTRFRPAFAVPNPDDSALIQAYLQMGHLDGVRRRLAAFVHLARLCWRRWKNQVTQNSL